MCFSEHHAMKAYWGSGGTARNILDIGTRWEEWSASRTSQFNPRERNTVTHCIGGWVGTITGLDVVVKRKTPSPYQNSNLRSCIPSPSAIPLSYPGSYWLHFSSFKFQFISRDLHISQNIYNWNHEKDGRSGVAHSVPVIQGVTWSGNGRRGLIPLILFLEIWFL
jgi:hypothetical protein